MDDHHIFTFTTRVMRDDIIGRGFKKLHRDDLLMDGSDVRKAALDKAEDRAHEMGWAVASIESFEEFTPNDMVAARITLNVWDAKEDG